jgi:predicted dithiol-disulfide oxidoreductase (DUF899 family)
MIGNDRRFACPNRRASGLQAPHGWRFTLGSSSDADIKYDFNTSFT